MKHEYLTIPKGDRPRDGNVIGRAISSTAFDIYEPFALLQAAKDGTGGHQAAVRSIHHDSLVYLSCMANSIGLTRFKSNITYTGCQYNVLCAWSIQHIADENYQLQLAGTDIDMATDGDSARPDDTCAMDTQAEQHDWNSTIGAFHGLGEKRSSGINCHGRDGKRR
jgi:hypothetical protein